MKRILLSLFLFASLSLWAQSPVAIGDILCTDGSTVKPNEFATSGKTALGIVFYVDETDTHGWAVALQDQSHSIKWCTSTYYGTDIPALTNYADARQAIHDLDGDYNTGILRNFTGSSSNFPAAWAVDYDHGWYLPSGGQLRHMFSYYPEINQSLQIVGGELIAYDRDNYYWSSTEYTGYHAYDMNAGGSLGDYVKDNHSNYPPSGISVRQIRDFEISTPIPSSHHLGELITNEDGSQGILFYITPDQNDGWMVALEDASTSAIWGDNGNIIHLADQTCNRPFGLLLDETDGFSNTNLIRNYQNNPNTAAGVTDFGNGWYLPTAGQLAKLFGSLAFIEDELEQYGSTFANEYYWSSSEASSSQAFALTFKPAANVRAGSFVLCDKVNAYRVRAVRNIHLDCLPEHYDLNISACQNYKWNDMVYTESGDYTHTFTDQNGCDSIVTLHLTIAETIYNTISQSTCDEYEWNGITYTEPGSYQQSFTTADGCDSIVTLNLSFDGIIEMTHEFTSCDSFTYHGETYEQSGVYSQLVPGSAGCDTLATLRLHIITTPHGTIEGPIQVYAATDLVTGLYNYHLDLQSQPYTSVTWLIDNEQWLLYPDGDNCQVYVTTPYSATLTAIVEYKGCISECTLTINATYFDVEEQEEILVSIYPNPANGSINIAGEGIEEVRIYNLLGQNILSQQGDGSNNIQISTNGLDAAIYLMEIRTQRGKTVKRVAIIK